MGSAKWCPGHDGPTQGQRACDPGLGKSRSNASGPAVHYGVTAVAGTVTTYSVTAMFGTATRYGVTAVLGTPIQEFA
jgi:hypothetical protein